MSLTDVAIDDETRLGPEGSGFQTMLEVVLPHFQIGVASVSVGIGEGGAFRRLSGAWGRRKYEHAGGAALASIPRVQFLVAEIALAVNSGARLRAGNNSQGSGGRSRGDARCAWREGECRGRVPGRCFAGDDSGRRLGVRTARRPGANFPRCAGGRRDGARRATC